MLLEVAILIAILGVATSLAYSYYVFFLKDVFGSSGVDKRIPRHPECRGMLGFMMWIGKNHLDFPARGFYEATAEYCNDDGLITFNFGHDIIVAASNPKVLELFYTDPRFSEKPDNGYKPIEILVGRGLVNVNNDEWKVQRTILAKTFHRQRLDTFTKAMVDGTKSLLSLVEEHVNAPRSSYKSLDFDNLATLTTMDIILRAMFRKDYNLLRVGRSHPIVSTLDNLTMETHKGFSVPFYFKWNWAARSRVRRYNQTLDSVFQSIIDDHRKQRAWEDESAVLDMVDLMLIGEDDDGNRLTDRMIMDECRTFWFAGHDTTAHTLAWALMLISTHEEVEKKVIAEVDEVFDDDREPTAKDVNRLRYIQQVCKEALRMFPPVQSTSRYVREDTDVHGYKIPKGTTFSLSILNVHLDEKYWPDPFRFDPERFAPGATYNQFAYVPFTKGPRQCIGFQFAYQEMRVVIAMLYRRYRFRLDRHKPLALHSLITTTPSQGVHLIPQRRTDRPDAST